MDGPGPVAIPSRGPTPCNTIALCFVKWGAVWGGRNPLTGLNPLQQWWETLFEAAAPGRNPLTGLNPLQLGRTASSAPSLCVRSQSPYGAQSLATRGATSGPPPRTQSRNPLTGLNPLQRYPPKNPVPDGTARGGVCEKDEAWNMHTANNGGF